MPATPPPATERDLLARAAQLAGKSLAQAAQEMDLAMPPGMNRHKGWIGTLAECFLGASAANLAEPDFQQLGIELKTVPINRHGYPKESTYVCVINLSGTGSTNWETSLVRKKLSRVLWLPVEGDTGIPLSQRRFGSALLWSPTAEQEAVLRNDWEEIMELIATGNLDQVRSTQGSYLQVRPKAANGAASGRYYAEGGELSLTLPRGFYLRASFTRTLFGN